jgi:hypothetical protein
MNTPRKISLIALAVLSAVSATAQTILMDLGGAASNSPEPTWNNIVENSLPTSSPRAMTDALTGLASGISAQFSGTWGTANSSGYASGTADFAATATQDSLFINTGNTGIITFSGLDIGKTYDFTLFASRTGTGTRNVTFSIAGATTNSTTVNVLNNSQSVSLSALAPAVNGTLTLSVFNTAGDNFAYLNALKLSASAVPEPSAYASLLGLGAIGFCLCRRKR